MLEHHLEDSWWYILAMSRQNSTSLQGSCNAEIHYEQQINLDGLQQFYTSKSNYSGTHKDNDSKSLSKSYRPAVSTFIFPCLRSSLTLSQLQSTTTHRIHPLYFCSTHKKIPQPSLSKDSSSCWNIRLISCCTSRHSMAALVCERVPINCQEQGKDSEVWWSVSTEE